METTADSDQNPLVLPITKCMVGNWEVTISNNHRFSWKRNKVGLHIYGVFSDFFLTALPFILLIVATLEWKYCG